MAAGTLGLVGQAIGVSLWGKSGIATAINVVSIGIGGGLYTGLIPNFMGEKKSNYAGCNCGGGY